MFRFIALLTLSPSPDINPASKHNFNYDCEQQKNNILLDTEFLNLLRKLLVMHLNGIPQHNTMCTAGCLVAWTKAQVALLPNSQTYNSSTSISGCFIVAVKQREREKEGRCRTIIYRLRQLIAYFCT